MTSAIDPTKPGDLLAYTADVRENFAAAKSEIEALQTIVATGPTNISSLPYAKPDGSPPDGAKTGDIYINGVIGKGGFLCIAP